MRQGPDPRPMIKGWLSQVVTRLRVLCPDECRKASFPVGVEVTGSENTGWVLFLDQGKVASRAKEDVKVTFFVPQSNLRAFSMNLRFKVWKEAFQGGTIKVTCDDPALLKQLEAIAVAVEKKEA